MHLEGRDIKVSGKDSLVAPVQIKGEIWDIIRRAVGDVQPNYIWFTTKAREGRR
jgi:hypothetical protein